MTREQILASVLLKRLRCVACTGVMQVDAESPYLPLAERGLAPIPLCCMSCHRLPNSPVPKEPEIPALPPLTGECKNGHRRSRFGYYVRDRRVAGGWTRRCQRCEDAKAAGSSERKTGWREYAARARAAAHSTTPPAPPTLSPPIGALQPHTALRRGGRGMTQTREEAARG